MSNIAIKGATTGTGVFTLESPATNTDRTLVLPDEAGTVLTTAGVPASAMPAGSVIQVVAVQSTTQVVINTTGAQSIGLSKSMTVAANSKVCMMSVVPWFDSGAGGSWSNAGTSSLWVDGVQVAYNEHQGTLTGEAGSWNNALNFLTAPLSAGEHTFEVKHAITIAGTHYVMRDGRLGTLILMEIAG